jgi:hypothetical protein
VFTTAEASATSLTITASSGYQIVRNCAEWIFEASTVGGVRNQIADYRDALFSECEAITDCGAAIDGGDNVNFGDGGPHCRKGVPVLPQPCSACIQVPLFEQARDVLGWIAKGVSSSCIKCDN